MNIIDYLKIYAVAVGVFFVVDLVWLGVVAKGIYQKYLGHLLKAEPNWPVAILFYLLFIAGLLVFVVIPAMEKGSWEQALYMGAFFGFITYMTYELTNYALIRGWPAMIVAVDIAWGVVLAGLVSIATFFIAGSWVK